MTQWDPHGTIPSFLSWLDMLVAKSIKPPWLDGWTPMNTGRIQQRFDKWCTISQPSTEWISFIWIRSSWMMITASKSGRQFPMPLDHWSSGPQVLKFGGESMHGWCASRKPFINVYNTFWTSINLESVDDPQCQQRGYFCLYMLYATQLARVNMVHPSNQFSTPEELMKCECFPLIILGCEAHRERWVFFFGSHPPIHRSQHGHGARL